MCEYPLGGVDGAPIVRHAGRPHDFIAAYLLIQWFSRQWNPRPRRVIYGTAVDPPPPTGPLLEAASDMHLHLPHGRHYVEAPQSFGIMKQAWRVPFARFLNGDALVPHGTSEFGLPCLGR